MPAQNRATDAEGTQATITKDEAPEQPQLKLDSGPYVKFIATDRYTHQEVTAVHLREAGVEPPAGFVRADWRPENGYLVPTSVFGDGGAKNPVVERLVSDPANLFAVVDKASE